jgi:hypothetical protein
MAAINGAPPRESTRFVAIFQKAHAHLAALQRIDEQIAALQEQRRRATDELRAIQSLINSEFTRVLETGRPIPAEALAQSEDLLAEAAGISLELKANSARAARELKPMGNPSARTPILQPTGS